MRNALSINYFLILLLFFFTSNAQDITVTGTVKDKGDNSTLAGVNIIVQGTAIGTVSDANGSYTLAVPADADTLLFKYIGYTERKFAVDRSKASYSLNVAMESGDVGLNPVVISASRRQEKILDAPASISIIDQEVIENQIGITPIDHIKTVPGVDIIEKGLVAQDVVLRGFNNIFSGAVLSIVDNRIASVPSLRVNAYQLIPSSQDDIERIEVVRGPASALYGPNASSGVVHIITQSPLDMEKDFMTKISAAGGLERSLLSGNIRHAGKINNKLGYKISARYLQAHDWEFEDPAEPDTLVLFRQTSAGFVSPDGDTIYTKEDTIFNSQRDEFITSYKVDGRIDYRFSDKTEIILSSGFTRGSNVEMTGLGAAQVIDWRYTYLQARFRHKSLFVQGFTNFSNAGNTYLLESGGLIVDKSKLYVGQIQHSYSPFDRLKFVYGFDAILTRPATDETINGRHEDDDAINEFGIYAQGDYDIFKKLTLVGALRADHHNFVDDIFLSPRAGIVFKPTDRHTLRATYNRAFDSPTSNNLNLDILQGMLPTGIPVRVFGNRSGFDFNYSANPYVAESPVLPKYLTPYAPDTVVGGIAYSSTNYANLHDPYLNNVLWDALKNFVVGSGFPTQLYQIVPEDIQGNNVLNDVKLLNLSESTFEEYDPNNISDFGPVKNAVTQTYEVGYKGILFDRMMVTLDFYKTDKKDFVSPLTLISPNVFLDPASLRAEIAPEITRLLYGPDGDPSTTADNYNLEPIFRVLLDTAVAYGGNNNGRIDDEITNIMAGAAARVPFGTITPNEAGTPQMFLTYINIGDITIYGFDLGVNFIVTENLRIGGSFSWVNKDTIGVPEAQFGYISLNAPKHKASANAAYRFKKIGLDIGATWRWQDTFLANSGVYVGPVPAFNLIDANIDYALPFSKETHVTLTMTNVLDHDYQSFVRTPFIGRLTMLRVSHTF